MTSTSRDSAERPRHAARPGAGPAAADDELASDSILIERISQGSSSAFAVLFDRTSEAVRAEVAASLPGVGRAAEILAASYIEVWWLAGCGGTPKTGARAWIIGIVRRRIAEASRAIPRPGGGAAMEPRPSYAELEVASLLRRPVDCLQRP